ncbi:MAG: class I SAM-dependent methyltransferase [Alphaproteobacteria bacterium]|nr:class I SAM-dependent methyltransferase [Alphaproteobacteria bacterium]
MSQAPSISVLETAGFSDYALLDCGGGRKLERFGSIVLDRPEAQAMWSPALGVNDWRNAHASFSSTGSDDQRGKWQVAKPMPESWPVNIDAVTLECRTQGLWHLGLFPEQLPHWLWVKQRLASVPNASKPPRVLNLFAYTGAASLIAAAAGGEVTHVDASKKTIAWAKDNQAASHLQDAKIRWILDDASKFVAREVRRGKTYDVILIDPPKFGRGPNGEVWDLFQSLPTLLSECAKLIAPGPAAIILTAYAIRASSLAFHTLGQRVLRSQGGTFECGELAVRSEADQLLPTSMYLKWWR